jgi:hypothetical protein
VEWLKWYSICLESVRARVQGLVPPPPKKIVVFVFGCQELVAYAYNPSYSGGRDQEDCGSKLAQADSS